MQIKTILNVPTNLFSVGIICVLYSDRKEFLEMLFKSVCLIAVVVFCLSEAAYINSPGQPFDFQCPVGQRVTHLSSVYDALLEDRQWDVRCSGSRVTQNCSSSGIINEFGHPINYKCPEKTVLTGIRSYHDNQIEDRRFSFRCCQLKTNATTECRMTDHVNRLTGPMLLDVPRGHGVVGAFSQHDVTHEDRSWTFQICKL
ncbi:hypothetical protein Btru_014864 [Bulinus truncatus]|nr:hypothetical protein Btru_014864 [Bulinus truncatus]